MPTIQECISIVQKASGLSNEEASDVVRQLAKEKERVRASGDIASLERKLGEYAVSQAEQQKIDVALKRKHAALNVLRRQEVDDYLTKFEQDTGDVYEGIMGLLGGSHKRVEGARNSIDSHRDAIRSEWVGDGVIKEMNARPHVLKMLRRDESFLEDVVREMYEVRPGGKRGITGSSDAAFAAEIFAKYSEVSRLRLNKAGAFIKKLEGWTPQGHDEWKIMKRAPEAGQWVDFVYPLLDHEKTFPGMSETEVRGILAEVHENIITGQNRRVTAQERGEFLGPRNFARSMGHERVLHFKDADNWLKYHKEFGHKNVFTSVVNHLDMASRRLALMERLGPNPENMLNSIIANRIRAIRNNPDLKPKVKQKMIERLKGVDLGASQGAIGRLYSDVAGNNLIPGDVTHAKIWSGFRSVQAMAKLGMAPISAMADTLTFAMNARFRGVNLFEAYNKAFKSLMEGRSKGEQREISHALGTLYDGILGDINSRWNAQDTVPGKMSKATNDFFKVSGLQYWTESLKSGYAKMMSNDLARMKSKAWSELSKQDQEIFSYHGIGEKDWDVIRRAVKKVEDGREYVLPELIDEQKLRTKLRAFFIDETKYAVIEPDARTRAVLTWGQRPGTKLGELARFVMQFKSFPIAYYQRNIKGRRFQAPGKGADLPGIAHWIVGAMVFGYAAMSVKDVLRGRKPRDPRNLNTWAAAALQSGGAGIYGDFLLAKYNRFSGSPLETAAGPFIGTASDVTKMVSTALHGDFRPADAFYTAINNTPYVNLWYTRTALDYALLYHVREMISPGTLRRTERRIKQDYNQEYMSPLRPSRVIKRGGGFK